MALLTVKDLTIGYESRVVLKNLNLSVQEGDYLCIVGENGCGKTTLMKTLVHLNDPLGGQIELGDGLKKNEIGYLPQQTDVQKDFPASVEEIVLSGCQSRCGLRPFYNREDKRLARDNMERMGVLALRRRCFRELAGGQQPVSGLDPRVSAQLYDLITSLNREGITIIMISHDLDAALERASHILHIGKNVFFGTKESYLNSEEGKLFLSAGRKEVSHD